MDALIASNVPYLMKATGMSSDQAGSFMGALLPTRKRWRAVWDNEREFGAEARALYGNEAVDAANKALLSMAQETWNNKEKLGDAIVEKLRQALPAGDPLGAEGQEIAALHQQWIRLQWGEGRYSPEAHAGLARMYLTDERFRTFYDSRAGVDATDYLVAAILHLCEK